MALQRHILSILAAALFVTSVSAQPTQIVASDGNFRSFVQSQSRVLGLDYASEVFFSEDNGQSFASLSVLSSDPLDTYYAMAALSSTVVSVGTDGLIARSADQGSSWMSSVNTDFISGDLRTVSGRSDTPNVWLAAGGDGFDGAILLSGDDGATWAESDLISDVGFHGSVWTGSAWLVCGLDELLFEGVIYRSTDGTSWTAVTLPVSTAPLLAIASDGAGNVVAVGESGTVLYSSDHGQNFVQTGQGLLSEDLSAVTASGINEFVIGGSGKSLLEAQGVSLSILRSPVGGAPKVEALLPVGGRILAGGGFASGIERTQPFNLSIVNTGLNYRLTINESLSGKVYTLQTSIDLEDWDTVANTSFSGSGGPLEWVEPSDGARRFWRVEEF